ncbi:MAG: aldehyde dehydrogenase family protein [Acidobacteriaceae bacterium]
MEAAVAERCSIESAITLDPDSRSVSDARAAQAAWATRPILARLAILRRARGLMAARASAFADAFSKDLPRTPADTLVAELLPLLDACRFLERRAAVILRTRSLGRRGLPWWLGGLSSEIERVPFGQILVFGPTNYPLFLPGVHTLQALAAGNSVVWKPGHGGRPVAELFASTLLEAGLPRDLLIITDESIEAGQIALAGRINGIPPSKVVFTGSVETGRTILHALAETVIPCVAELSGCDAVIALPSASLDRLVEALCFGMRLNGSATCMAPRRLLLLGFTPERRDLLLARLRASFAALPPVAIPHRTADHLHVLLQQALRDGAVITGASNTASQAIAPIVVTNIRPGTTITCADIFAPVLSVIDVLDESGLLAAEQQCPYALTVSIFGDERQARTLAHSLTAGTILLNDIIVPTADPRVPFGGRRRSGFGATRGAEGLLEMTAARTLVARSGNDTRRYQATGPHHTGFFEGIIRLSHTATWAERWHGLRQFLAAARNLR